MSDEDKWPEDDASPGETPEAEPDAEQTGVDEAEVDYSQLPAWARPPGYEAPAESGVTAGEQVKGEGISGPATFAWAQQLGFALAILFFASTLVSWALTLEASTSKCISGSLCYWTQLGMAPAIGALHGFLGALALLGSLALRRRDGRATWFFLVPDLYLILYGSAAALLGVVYWSFGWGWLLIPGFVFPLGVAHLTCLVHPTTRRYLRKAAAKRQAQAEAKPT